MEHTILISELNDFIFCPYSIYLHNVYMDTDEGEYHSHIQTRGRIAHESVDTASGMYKKEDRFGMYVGSKKYGLTGKIDVYKSRERLLVERKYELKHIYRGQIYQLWAQYFCMTEMGYVIDKLAFYEISTKKTTYLDIPSGNDIVEFELFLESFRQFNPETPITANPNKCRHCIYCNICEKTVETNVYD